MTGPSSQSLRLRSLPEVQYLLPGVVVRGAFAVVAGFLCVARLPGGIWLVAALGAVALAVVIPRTLAAWVLLAGLGVDQALAPQPSAGIEVAALIAGVHLLHVLGAQMLVVPASALVQASVLLRMLVRFAVIQAPVQIVAWVALALFSPSEDVAVPAAGVVGAIAIIVLSCLLAVPLLRERAQD